MEESAVKLAATYKGATLNFHYDDRTGTYYGMIDGYPLNTRRRISTYKALIDALFEAVEARH